MAKFVVLFIAALAFQAAVADVVGRNPLSLYFNKDFDQYDTKYGYSGQYRPYGYGYAGKYDQYDSEYGYAGQFRPYAYGYSGKYDQFDSEYGFAGQFRPYAYGYSGKYDQYDSQYGYFSKYFPRGYGYEKYGYSAEYQPYGYGYSGAYDQYDSEYSYPGLYRPYGYGYSGKYEQYGYPAQYGYEYGSQSVPATQLAKQAEIYAQQIYAQFQAVPVSGQQFRQFAIYQAYKLVQVIDNMIDRFQAEFTGYGYPETTIQQFVAYFREIQAELQQIARSGTLTTVPQIKAQFFAYLERIASHLYKLAMFAESDAQVQEILVKNVIVQYLGYLRHLQYQVQSNVYGQSYTGYGYGGDYESYTPKYYQQYTYGY